MDSHTSHAFQLSREARLSSATAAKIVTEALVIT
jgi:hypothetical protein